MEEHAEDDLFDENAQELLVQEAERLKELMAKRAKAQEASVAAATKLAAQKEASRAAEQSGDTRASSIQANAIPKLEEDAKRRETELEQLEDGCRSLGKRTQRV